MADIGLRRIWAHNAKLGKIKISASFLKGLEYPDTLTPKAQSLLDTIRQNLHELYEEVYTYRNDQEDGIVKQMHKHYREVPF